MGRSLRLARRADPSSFSGSRLTIRNIQAAGEATVGQIPYVPEVTAQASAQYSWPLSPAYRATLRHEARVLLERPDATMLGLET